MSRDRGSALRQFVIGPVKKKPKKQEQDPSRFLPCPVCHRSFPSYSIHDHVNICLDSPPTQSTPSTTSPLPPQISEDRDQVCSNVFDAKKKDAHLDARLKHPPSDQDANLDASLKNSTADQDCTNPLLACSSAVPLNRPDGAEIHVVDGLSCEGADGEARDPNKPGHVLQIFQMQRQSQAKLSMLRKFPVSAALERKPTATVLQPGMVLMRSWLSLDVQQRLVNESQSAAHLFKRPTTAGGGKYHLWQMAFGCQWDSKTRRYAAETRGQRFPAWMYDLGKELASDASGHTHVYPPGSSFAPDVALVNFYPVKDEELGVVGLGGHQDLDDYCDMPVVSVSVGDSMTFFYRRVPPQSRRKSGIQIVVDESAAKTCKDGDTAHNSEKKVVLESGDVLVFGGESRLVFHGTRCVQPGTRPRGLHMAPGRLNFTFRQCNAPTP